MPDIIFEQAWLDQTGQCLARSPGFIETWRTEAQRLVAGFGEPRPGAACPRAVFAQPLTLQQVAVVQVLGPDFTPGLSETEARYRFHFLVLNRTAYERCYGDPFALARRFPAPAPDQPLSTLTIAMAPPPRRTVDQVREILQRVKANALPENEDPENASGLTAANAESPALLGGVQILVDGGKLVFERPAPDQDLVEGLWTLLPQSTRANLWPTSFAFSNELGFDVVVLPRVTLPFEEGYTLEENAADYPEGRYELALQTAAEAGDQNGLDQLFTRRSSRETMRMAVILLLLITAGVWLIPRGDSPPAPLTREERIQRAGVAAGVVAVGDPLTALMIIEQANRLYLKAENDQKR